MNPPLTGDQLVDLELKIEDLIAELEATLDENADSAAPVQLDSAIGRVTRADAMINQEMAKAARLRMDERLMRLKQARQRMDEGTYGMCERCDGDIDFPRLEAQPEATHCTQCPSKS